MLPLHPLGRCKGSKEAKAHATCARPVLKCAIRATPGGSSRALAEARVRPDEGGENDSVPALARDALAHALREQTKNMRVARSATHPNGHAPAEPTRPAEHPSGLCIECTPGRHVHEAERRDAGENEELH